ncbi:GDP-L-fucose synthase family protein [Calditerrivibrio nitroreducens]|uniref:GDP-L-fucose synthase n=1 Tax=Calditerrivibrio nitroreducens (strain DSM 19672 / NBRC 101217 / Yu37-1) TaxID=768670 RepID=E4TIM7_CALNY|nr:GDP-L-fucose synthase [Calditerrivibrio nitroreducens]ADR19075.1 GDP-L-fucose synthase [Calditerrivibrio nitroreducens DSM 19672]
MKNNSTFNIHHSSLQKSSKIFVAGASGLVGSAIVRKLIEKGYTNIVASYRNRKPNNSTFNIQHSTLNMNSVQYINIDLLDSLAVSEFFKQYTPEFVFLAAAKVGGIVANNTYRADFIYENLQIQNNVIYNAYKYGVKKLLFLGSTCIYPKNCPQPIKEEYLLTAPLEYTNEPYAIAKIAGIKMCESFNLQYGTNFISVMPTNLYGPNDNFDLEKSHVLPALIRKMHLGKCLEEDNWEAIRKDLNKNPIEGIDGSATKEEILAILEKYGIKKQFNIQNSTFIISIEIWGSGKPMREFLHVDDMADACVFVMEKVDIKQIINQQVASSKQQVENSIPTTHYSLLATNYLPHFINIGTGTDISIKDLAYLIKDIVGFKGEFYFNTDKPDGTMKKLTDVSKLHSLGWKHTIELKDGIENVYTWYLSV